MSGKGKQAPVQTKDATREATPVRVQCREHEREHVGDTHQTSEGVVHFGELPLEVHPGQLHRRVLLSEPLTAEQCALLLTIPGYERAGEYTAEQVAAVDDAIARTIAAASAAAATPGGPADPMALRTIDELQRTNQEVSAERNRLASQVQDLRAKLEAAGPGGDAKLQARVDELSARCATLEEEKVGLIDENARLRRTNEELIAAVAAKGGEGDQPQA